MVNLKTLNRRDMFDVGISNIDNRVLWVDHTHKALYYFDKNDAIFVKPSNPMEHPHLYTFKHRDDAVDRLVDYVYRNNMYFYRIDNRTFNILTNPGTEGTLIYPNEGYATTLITKKEIDEVLNER